MTFVQWCCDLDAWLCLHIGEMGLYKIQDENRWLYYFRVRKETFRYRVCIDHDFAVTSYIDKIVFPGEERWLLW